jgi:CubicO group peptidase (beta-lactamase class C family)
MPVPVPAAPASALPSPQPNAEELAVDRIFADFQGGDRPGCAVGVARDGRPLLTRAYGLANLDDGTPNTPDSIFEAASVSKQFTASAIVLLARQGKLSLDDDVRKYLPELPAYERPITLRRMLTHTSGLRDWGAVEDVAGWPRGTRNYTQASVLDIVRRQRALNFAPGDDWSYSNSNYNLAAIVVERVSGLSFTEFTRQTIFAPLGMTHTRWRDDYTRVVPGRSIAYSLGKDHEWHVDMPIEDAIGNGGLLTTVGDLLRWNANFAHPVVGDATFVSTLETPATLETGRTTRYGLGLWLDTMNGARSISHDGATAGYRSYLERLPDHGLSIAILCNAGSAQTSDLDLALAKTFLPAAEKGPETPPVPTYPAPAVPALTAIAGLYRSERTGGPVTVTADGAVVKLDGARADFENVHLTLCAETETTLRTKRGSRLEVVDPKGKSGGAPQRLRLTFGSGGGVDLTRVAAWQPDARALQAFQGEYWSDEAEARFSACVRDGKLVLLQGPERVIALEPSYPDVFTASDPEWLVSFRRAGAAVRGLAIGTDRAWKLPLTRTGAGVCAVMGGAGTGAAGRIQ